MNGIVCVDIGLSYEKKLVPKRRKSAPRIACRPEETIETKPHPTGSMTYAA